MPPWGFTHDTARMDVLTSPLCCRFYVATTGATAQHDEAWIRHVLRKYKFDAQVTNITNEHGVLSVMGRTSRAIVQAIADNPADFDDSEFAYVMALVRSSGCCASSWCLTTGFPPLQLFHQQACEGCGWHHCASLAPDLRWRAGL